MVMVFVHIGALCEEIVINFFTSRPFARQWSSISYIKVAICEAMVNHFFVTSRPSTMQWSSISLHQGPLWGNGHWFLCHIKTLCETMIINFFISRPSMKQWSLIYFYFDIGPLLEIALICFFKKVRKEKSKKSDLLNWDPLHGNGHRIF